MTAETLPGSGTTYDAVYLLEGVRTGFGEVNGTLREISATDLGIAVARGVLDRAEMPAEQLDMVIATNLSPSDFDSYYLPRHIGLYAGVSTEVPCILVHRLCGSGFETLAQAADYIKLGKAETALCVGGTCLDAPKNYSVRVYSGKPWKSANASSRADSHSS